MKNKDCPLCEKKLYSDTGHGCKMCGMLLEEWDEEFCSDVCEENFKEINNTGGKK